MDYRELPPPPFLRPLVRCFWFLRGTGHGGGVQTLVPDGRTEIVLHLREPFALVDESGVTRRQSRALAAGQLLGPLRLAPSADADVVGIRLETEAAGSVLGGGLTELTGQVAPLAEVARRLEAALLDAVASAGTPEDRREALAGALARASVAPPDALVRGAVAALDQPRPGAGRIGELSRALGTTPRTLERRVRGATGLSPRALRAVFRFRRAFRRLDRSPPGAWARVAAEAGYYDQAHLIRDFRRFAGTPPGRFFQLDPALARTFAEGG